MKEKEKIKFYQNLRTRFLSKITRSQLNNLHREVPILKDRKDIFLFRHYNNDFCLFFWACLHQMNNVINFCINNCDIQGDIKQSFEELEMQLYECSQCHFVQCNIDKIIEEKFTPLLLTVWFGNVNSVENLLSIGQQQQQQQQKFNVDEESYPLGITPLMLACSRCDFQMVKCLIKQWNANIVKCDKNGKSTLMYTLLGGKSWKMCLSLKRECKEGRGGKEEEQLQQQQQLQHHQQQEKNEFDKNNYYCNDDDYKERRRRRRKEEEQEEEEEKEKYKICQILLENGAVKILYEKDKISGLNVIDICNNLNYFSVCKLFNLYYKTKEMIE